MTHDINQKSGQRWLFVHDHHFVRCRNGTVGSIAQFEASLWSRYLTYCDHLTVLGREKFVDSENELFVSSRDDVSFRLVEDHGRGLSRITNAGVHRDVVRDLVAEHDAIIARLPSELGLQAVVEAKAAGKPVAVEAVGCPWDALQNYGSFTARMYAPLATLRMRRAVKEADQVIYVTERFLQGRYPPSGGLSVGASDVELTPITSPGGAPCLDPNILKRRLARIEEMGERQVRLGLIGSLQHRSKGVQFVLRALQDLNASRQRYTFHVLGPGDREPWRAEANELGVSDVVQFEGTLPGGEAVNSWLDEIDVYLQPSLQEGLPRALVEAMGRACPAIGSTCAGIPELLEDDLVVAKRSVPDLVRAVDALANDKARLARTAKRNFAKAEEFLPHALAERRDGFFRALHEKAAA